MRTQFTPEAMQDLRERATAKLADQIESVDHLVMNADDVIAIRVDGNVTSEQAQHIREVWLETGLVGRVIVMPSTMHVTKLTKSEIDRILGDIAGTLASDGDEMGSAPAGIPTGDAS